MEPLTRDGQGGGAAVNDREAALDGRDRVAGAWNRAGDRPGDLTGEREAMLARREDAVQAILAAADERDRLAEQRDRRAEQRDEVADMRPFTSPEEYAAAAARDRGLAAEDRFESGVERDRSAGDRARLAALPRCDWDDGLATTPKRLSRTSLRAPEANLTDSLPSAAAEGWSVVDFVANIIMRRLDCTAEEASELLSDSARGHHVSVSDLALCVVLDLELR
jgi:hypothetical protein